MTKIKEDKTIGFIGLGLMGLPMSVRLLEAGYEVKGNSSNAQRAQAFQDKGGRIGKDLRDIVTGADIIITMIPDGPILESIVDQVKDSIAPGSLLIDMSTVGSSYAKKAADALQEKQIHFIDAPVSGGVKGAADGTLSIMVGGCEKDFSRALPVFNVLGKNISHFGAVGSGQTVKSANQILVAANMSALAECVLLLEETGIDVPLALKTLQGGLADSAILRAKADKMANREFSNLFALSLHLKDLRIAASALDDAQLIAPVSMVVKELYGIGEKMGLGELDHSALIGALEQINAKKQGEVRNNG